MNESALENLDSAVDALLVKEPVITPEKIREWIATFRMMPPLAVSDEAAEALAKRLEARHVVTMSIGAELRAREFRPWLEKARAGIDFYYWERYKKLLAGKKLSGKVVAAMDKDTERTLGLLENPVLPGPWSRKGMVVGHVQSGKTANYTGLICKAADAGYRLIIVIAGVHNSLRNQTQRRIDEGFVGRDSARLLTKKEEHWVGVGKVDARRRPVTFTTSLKDFNRQMAIGVGVPLKGLVEPVVFVVKKNPSSLRNLKEWLSEHNSGSGGGAIDEPMLLIDDEADNASINVAYSKEQVSQINSQIRGLLQLFVRNCYVGYTATPFANIFIDPDTDDEMLGEDLFPRHFIVSLDPPSNYFGPSTVFRDAGPQHIRHIDDADAALPLKHRKEHALILLPQSLVDALRTYVVARAIRIARGQATAHSSMLVNVSRFTAVQAQVAALLQDHLGNIQASIRVNGRLPRGAAERDPEIAGLKKVWQQEYGTAGTWEHVREHLRAAAEPIRIVEVNSRSHGVLNYSDYEKEGLAVLAVGGFALSRGLTLEGLMVSYFLRNSVMYDTLMQMGRWFGYREGYQDLCRIWMPEDAEGWYAHIAESVEELREELRSMAAAGATPEEFGLKVRSHPDTLIVTARNRMGSGKRVVVSVGLANEFVETATLRAEPANLEHNRGCARELAAGMASAGVPWSKAEAVPGGLLQRNVPSMLIRRFVENFRNHPGSLLTEPGPVARYIKERENDELAFWDVLLPSVSDREHALKDNALGIEIVCQQRTAGTRSDETTIRVTNKQRVASRGVERTGLGPEAIAKVEAQYRADKGIASADGESVNYPDRIYRKARVRPLFILHLLDLRRTKNGPRWGEEPIVAWSISFPSTGRTERRVEYVVTTTWLRENFPDESEEDEGEADYE